MITFSKLGYYGKLGNQMFQYACLFSVAKKNNYEFCIPSNNVKLERPYWYDTKFFLSEIFNISCKYTDSIKTNHVYVDIEADYNSEIFNISDNTDIIGYFQSEKYFKLYENEIRKEFSFKNNNLVEDIKNNFPSGIPIVGMHVRRGDYLLPKILGTHGSCSIDYYISAIQHIKNILKSYICLYVFSDDIEWCKSNLNKLNNFIVYDESPRSESEYYSNQETSLIKMSLCDHFICANSSFSWW